MSKLNNHLSKNAVSIAIFLFVIAIVLVVFSFLSPVFMTKNNILRAIKHLSITSIAALGLTFVITVGYSDMSFHFVSCFAGMTMSFFIGKMVLPPLPSIFFGLLAGCIFGVINGIAVGKYKLPDMIATIGIGSFAWGMAYLYSKGNYIYENFLTSGIINFCDGKLYGIPYPVIYLFVFYTLAYIFLHRTKYGRGFYATGSNQVAALFSGINIENYIISAYVISNVLSSFTNMVMTAAQGNGNVKGGLVLLMPAYSAVFIGMSIFRKPTIIGTFCGSFLISIIQNGFTLLNAPFYFMDMTMGATLIISIIISKIEFKRKKEMSEISQVEAE
ncbi:MAG TPA: ABC transporter permease [Anaerolineae bacterium]|nr:ABC transporter permease [Anaerolineae bacterium]